MGFIDKLTDAVSSSSTDTGASDEIAEEFEEEGELLEGEMEGLEEGLDEEVEEEQEVWDSAYRFFEDYVEGDGHMDGMDFAKSAAFFEIQNSNLYRDRLKSGRETIEMVATAKETIESVKGGSGSTDYKEKAEELKHANELIEQVDKVSGKEDEMIQEALSVGKDLADGLTKQVVRNRQDVESEVRAHDREL